MSKQNENDSDANIFREFSKQIKSPVGVITGFYKEYVQFDAEQMIRETRISKNPTKEHFIAKAKKEGATITFSVMQISPNGLAYMVSLTGSTEGKEKILEEFKKLFGEGLDNAQWESMSFSGAQVRDSYIWHAIMKKTEGGE